ncbi:hypothetical protein ACP70R_024227 [Stipagrostis hirtigluma subsp. patula]
MRVDLIKDKLPQLPHVTSLSVHVHVIWERHSFGDGVAGLLTRFNNLKYLRLQQDEFPGYIKMDDFCSNDNDRKKSYNVCDHPDDWKPNDISLPHLEEAEFRGLTGTDCELRFLQSVLASTTGLQMVTINFNSNYCLNGRKEDFQIMLLGDGTWTAYHDDDDQWYEWRPSP